jgi:hypothetical protein
MTDRRLTLNQILSDLTNSLEASRVTTSHLDVVVAQLHREAHAAHLAVVRAERAASELHTLIAAIRHHDDDTRTRGTR